jgi:tripartite-type tricarboxylate transporter receptor subunit TctC
MAEAGLPGFEAVPFYGVAAPSKVPSEIVRKLNEDIDQVIHQAALAPRWTELGIVPLGGSPERANEFFATETIKWTRVIKAADIHAE